MASNSGIAGDVIGAVSLALVLILVGTLAGDPTLGALIGIVCFLLAVYAMFRSPIRHSMMGLMFLALLLPNPAEGQPTTWAPPFTPVGAALLDHLNTVSPMTPIPLATVEIFFIVLGLIRLLRNATGSRIDRDALPTPKPLIKLAHISLGATMFTWLFGLVRGGEMSWALWQVNAVIYLPIIFLLFQTSFRGPKDHWNLGRLVIIAAVYKSLLAAYVVYTTVLPTDPETGSTKPPYGTAHSDSILFATAFIIVIGMLLERTSKRVNRLAIVVLPIIMLGVQANNRRLAWVQIGIALFMVFLVSRETKLKKGIKRTVAYSLPVLAIYTLIGWNQTYSRVFKPVRIIRSVVDAKTDASSMWREYENVNIIATFRTNPLFGVGYGHPYLDIVILPQVDYSLEKYIPHNSLLGLWAYGGLVNFIGITLLWASGVYFAMRAYRRSEDPQYRAAALVAFGTVPIYLMQSWGDLGLGCWTGVFSMGAALTVSGKVAVASGQWTEGTQKPKAMPAGGRVSGGSAG